MLWDDQWGPQDFIWETSRNCRCLPCRKHGDIAFLCAAALVAQTWPKTPRKPLSFVCGTCHTKGWAFLVTRDWHRYDIPKMSHLKWCFNNPSVLLSNGWSAMLSGKALNQNGGKCKNNINGAGAAVPEKLPCISYVSTFGMLKQGKIIFKLDIKLHCAPKNCLQR